MTGMQRIYSGPQVERGYLQSGIDKTTIRVNSLE